MSDHPVSSSSTVSGLPGLIDLVTTTIRKPDEVAWDGATSTSTYRFTVDLTTQEAATFVDLVATLRTRNVDLTPAEYQAIKPDIAGLRTYAGIATPTLAQTAAAVKAQSRVLRALLRDG